MAARHTGDVSNVTEVEVTLGDDGDFYWHGKAGNHEIVAQSEGYTRKDDAISAAKAVFPNLEVQDGTQADEAQVGDQDQEEQAGESAASDGDEEGSEDSGEQAAGGEEE